MVNRFHKLRRFVSQLAIVVVLAGAGLALSSAAHAAPLASDDVWVALSDGTRFVGDGQRWSDYFCSGQEICKTGDVNGDGRDDIIAFARTTFGPDDSDVYVALSYGDRFGPRQKWHDYFCTLQEICAVADVNGDGRADIIAFVRTNNGANDSDVYVALSTGSSFGPGQKWHDYFCTLQEICAVGDVNGDAKADIIAFVRTNNGVGDSDVWVALSTGSGFGPGQKWHDYFCTLQEICAVGDVNGDGKADIIAFVRTNNGINDSDIYVALSDGTKFVGTGLRWHDYFCTLQEVCGVGDFNGDGKDDVVAFTRTASEGRTVRTIDLVVSMWHDPSPQGRATYERIFGYFADGIYEMTNGAHRIGTITVYVNRERPEIADVIWENLEWPHAGVAGRSRSGEYLWMADIFYAPDPDGDGPGTALGPYFPLNTGKERGGGYTMAHEWGHFYYGLYDEYKANAACDPKNPTEADITSPWKCDVAVQNSVMTNQWRADNADDLNWLNFSIAANQTSGNANRRVYGVSGWQVLTRDPKNDPKDGQRKALATRAYYSDLAAVAPSGANAPSIELPNSSARSALNVVWMPPGQVAAKAPQADGYRGLVYPPAGPAIVYPDAGRIVARLDKEGDLITKADVSATVTDPDGTATAFVFRDDGLAPDGLADDGLYTAIMPYSMPGRHRVEVTFTNSSGLAEFTYNHFHYTPGPNGETYDPPPSPVGESFTEVVSADIMVTGFQRGFTGALPPTQLTLDNRDFPGRIDSAGDQDTFVFVPDASGEVVLRVTDLALDMQPHIRVYQGDPGALIGEYRFAPVGDEYFFKKLAVEAGQQYTVEVAHLDPTAASGVFSVSVGPALLNTVETLASWRLFLPHVRN
ncbi:MAG: FG-GAP-like repeat-containing protein [Anaerolineae bacterium]